MIMYKITPWSPRIDKVDVLRATDKTVWIKNELHSKPDRHHRITPGGVQYHATFEEAHQELIGIYQNKLAHLDAEEAALKDRLADISARKAKEQELIDKVKNYVEET